MRKFWYVVLLLLGACAPAISGSSVRDAIVVENRQTVEVERGSELYLRLEFTLEEFGLDRRDLSGAFWIPAGVNEESANLATRFAMRDARSPVGWGLELAEVRAYRTTEIRYGRDAGTISYRISPVLRVEVPANAELGTSTVRAVLATRGGASVDMEIPMRVRAARK